MDAHDYCTPISALVDFPNYNHSLWLSSNPNFQIITSLIIKLYTTPSLIHCFCPVIFSLFCLKKLRYIFLCCRRDLVFLWGRSNLPFYTPSNEIALKGYVCLFSCGVLVIKRTPQWTGVVNICFH
jgi:hypothetical protein